jgi:hypothetical protein
MRPKNRGMVNSKEKEIASEQNKVDLSIIDYESGANKAKDIIEDVVMQEVKENWEVSKEEYLIHLAK